MYCILCTEKHYSEKGSIECTRLPKGSMVQIKVKNSWTDTINGSKMMRMMMVILTAAGTVIALLR